MDAGVEALIPQRASRQPDLTVYFFNRPTHFVGRAPNGATRLKRRLLAARGLRVVSVPHYEWDFLTDAQQDAYLSAKLSAAAA